LFDAAYKLKIAAERGVLTVTASGSYALRRSLRMISAVREHAERHALTRVLLETTAVPQPIPDVDLAALGEEAARTWQGLTVAILHRSRTPGNSAAVVARNRGANVRVFSSDVDAMNWLTGRAVDRPAP